MEGFPKPPAEVWTTDCFGTPLWLAELVASFRDGIDVDPCSNEWSIVEAAVKYFLGDAGGGGLVQQWFGLTYFNGPYSKIEPWLAYGWDQWRESPGLEAICLVKNDWTTEWWQEHIRGMPARCEMEDRLAFRTADGPGDSAMFPTTLGYLGYRPNDFQAHFGHLGEIIRGHKRP